MVTQLGDVVAPKSRQGDGGEFGDSDLVRERSVFGDDLVEASLRPVDEVHLVDRQHHVADAEEAYEIAVAACLGQHTLAGVDQDHRHVGRRSAGDHVAGVLLVTWGVGDDEFAPVGREEAVGDVDRDALLPLRGQAIDEEGEVDLAALGADPAGVRLERRQLILEDHLRVVEQPSDQGGLAVVDRTAGEEPQEALDLMGLQIGLDVLGDQLGLMGHQK